METLWLIILIIFILTMIISLIWGGMNDSDKAAKVIQIAFVLFILWCFVALLIF